MSGENDDNSLLKWFAGAAAAAAAGSYMLWNKFRTKSLDEIEAEAFKTLQEADNPFSDRDLENMRKAQLQLQEVAILRDLEKRKQQGLPIDENMNAALRDLVKHSFCFGDGNLQKQQEAFGRLTQQIQQTYSQLRQSGASRYSRCDFCGGAGYNVCPTCGGIGRNNLMSPPNYTGDRVADELLSLRYRNDSVCRHCNGSGQLICRFCNSAASGRR